MALKANQIDECIAALDEAEELLNRSGERWWETETLRSRGALLVAQKKYSEAEISFEKARALAQKKEAKLLELRATTSLARLWQQQGKLEQALKTLSEIHNWFTEGVDEFDLKQAKVLLEELSSSTDAVAG